MGFEDVSEGVGERVVGEGGVNEHRWSHTCAKSKTNLSASQISLQDRVREKLERETKEEERERKKEGGIS